VDVTANRTESFDIEGIYDGQIEKVCTHPADGSTVTCEFSVTESDVGEYDFRYQAITDSPNGDFLAGTETRFVDVNSYPTTVNFDNFQPADGQTFGFNEEINISADVTVDALDPVDVEGIADGTIQQVFNHPADGSTQSYEFNVSYDQNRTDVDYRFNVITSSPDGDSLGDTNVRFFDVVGYNNETEEPTDPTKPDGLFAQFGAFIGEYATAFIEGIISGLENNTSDGNQAIVFIFVTIILASIVGYLTNSTMGMASMVLLTLAGTVKGWLPSWIGFVFIVMTAVIIGWFGAKVTSGG